MDLRLTTYDLFMEIIKHDKTALVFGATGLIGKHLVNALLKHEAYTKVVVFVRKKLKIEHPNLKQHLIDFDRMEDYKAFIKGNDLYCTLGTTRAKAGSKEAFYKVDYTYSYKAAKIAAANGINQYLLVSAVGADANSKFFYNQVKGELEDAVKQLPFWAIHIFQPSVLLGERNENRWGEQLAARLGKIIDRFTGGLLTKYRPIEAEVVATAMIGAAQRFNKGTHVYPSHYLQNLSEEVYNGGRLTIDGERPNS